MLVEQGHDWLAWGRLGEGLAQRTCLSICPWFDSRFSHFRFSLREEKDPGFDLTRNWFYLGHLAQCCNFIHSAFIQCSIFTTVNQISHDWHKLMKLCQMWLTSGRWLNFVENKLFCCVYKTANRATFLFTIHRDVLESRGGWFESRCR